MWFYHAVAKGQRSTSCTLLQTDIKRPCQFIFRRQIICPRHCWRWVPSTEVHRLRICKMCWPPSMWEETQNLGPAIVTLYKSLSAVCTWFASPPDTSLPLDRRSWIYCIGNALCTTDCVWVCVCAMCCSRAPYIRFGCSLLIAGTHTHTQNE